MEIKAKIFQPRIIAKITGGGGSGGSMSLSAIQELLNQLPEYTNDEEAVADGLGLNDLYWVAEGSDSNIPGNLRRVTNV